MDVEFTNIFCVKVRKYCTPSVRDPYVSGSIYSLYTWICLVWYIFLVVPYFTIHWRRFCRAKDKQYQSEIRTWKICVTRKTLWTVGSAVLCMTCSNTSLKHTYSVKHWHRSKTMNNLEFNSLFDSDGEFLFTLPTWHNYATPRSLTFSIKYITFCMFD